MFGIGGFDDTDDEDIGTILLVGGLLMVVLLFDDI